MSDTSIPSPKKVVTKQQQKKTIKKPAEHPKYIEMITTAITTLKERTGSSRQAITKYVKANYKVGESCDVHVKLALKRGVKGDLLQQVKGTGASGSFKVVKKPEPKKKPTVKKPAAVTKKPVAKKSKVSKKITPKKKKPAAKKSTSAKKPVKKPVKKTAKKGAAAKKPAAKKTPKKKTAAKKSKK